MSNWKRRIVSIFIFLMIATTLFLVRVPASPQTILSIEPSSINVAVGNTFSVSLMITDVVDLYSWEVRIDFDPNAIECIGAEEGPFLISVGPTTWPAPLINNTAGYIQMACALLAPPGASGSGILADITFRCISAMESPLLITSSTLLDSATEPIPHEIKDGYVYQVEPTFIWKNSYPDYAPSGVPDFDQKQDAWTNPVSGAWSWCGPTAVANSLWWMDSRFETNLIPPPTVIDNFALVQSYDGWDDHDPNNVDPFIRDLAWFMDTDGQRTGLTHSGTKVDDMQAGIAQYLSSKGLNPKGDCNGDGFVDYNDIKIIENAYGSSPGDPNWDMRADINQDNTVSVYDIVIAADHYGEYGMFYEKTVKMPTFDYIVQEVEKCEDVILLLGFWQEQPPESENWVRIGGHYVTVAGVDPNGKILAFSDPFTDNAELTGNGVVKPPPPHPHPPNPPDTVHNNASYVSHDFYSALIPSSGPSPGNPNFGVAYEPEMFYDLIDNFQGQNCPDEFEEQQGGYNQLWPISVEVEYAIVISPMDWYFKPGQPDYAPHGIPDFDQRQDNWTNPYPPVGTWSWCGPTALANSFWWLDSRYEPGNTPPPEISDGFPLVTAYGEWDDHDPNNAPKLIEELAWYVDCDGLRTGDQHCGTFVWDMQAGIEMYVEDKGLTWKFYEHTVERPDFNLIEKELKRCQDVILLLGFWQYDPDIMEWTRVGGHYVTVAGVDSMNMRIAISDPIRDHAAEGYPGFLLYPESPPDPVPPELHNNASWVSYDFYNVIEQWCPGGDLSLEGYIEETGGGGLGSVENFIMSNFPTGEMQPYQSGLPIYTQIEYAVIVSCKPGVVAAGSEDGNVYVNDFYGNLLWQWNTSLPVVSVALDTNGTYLVSGSRDLPEGPGLLSFYDVNAGPPPLWTAELPISESYDGGWAGTESKSVDIKYNIYNQFDVVAAATDNGLYLFDQYGNLIWEYLETPITIVRISQDGKYIAAADYHTGNIYLFSHLRDGTPGWGPEDGLPLWFISGLGQPGTMIWVAISGLGDYMAVGGYHPEPGPFVALFSRNGTMIWQYSLPKGDYIRVDMPCNGRSIVSVNDDPSDSKGCDLNYFSDLADGTPGWSSSDNTPIWSYWPGKENELAQNPYHDFYTVAISENGDVIATGGADGISNIYMLNTNGTILQKIPNGITVNCIDLTFTGQFGIAGDGTDTYGFFDKDQGLQWTYTTGGRINSVAISKFYPCMFPYPNHNVAVTALQQDIRAKTVIGQNNTLRIYVNVTNYGSFTETFEVVIWARGPFTSPSSSEEIDIARQRVTLNPGETTTLILTWNASAPKGIYTLYGEAEIMKDEIYVYNNELICPKLIYIVITGDIDHDGSVGLTDLVKLALAYGSKPGDPNWDPNCDLDDNGSVGLTDLVKLALYYGSVDPWP